MDLTLSLGRQDCKMKLPCHSAVFMTRILNTYIFFIPSIIFWQKNGNSLLIYIFLGVMVQGWKVLADRKLCQLKAEAAALSLRDEP